MDDAELMVDGNALAGALREVFVHEMTSARIACDGCGKVEPIGAEHAYMQAPGVVLRCRHCEDVLLVMTRGGGSYLLGFQGSRWLEIAEEP
jgi:ribosomal protein S27E